MAGKRFRKIDTIPDPCSSLNNYHRYYGLDIEGMGYTELQDEYHAIRSLVWWQPDERWLRERVQALEAELIKRQAGYQFKLRPKPKLAEGVKL